MASSQGMQERYEIAVKCTGLDCYVDEFDMDRIAINLSGHATLALP